MAWQVVAQKTFEAARKSPAAQKAAAGAATAIGTAVGGVMTKTTKGTRERRQCKRMALDHARQMQGQYSENTIVAGQRRFVVWKDGVPQECYPKFEGELGERSELQNFPAELLRHPPPAKS